MASTASGGADGISAKETWDVEAFDISSAALRLLFCEAWTWEMLCVCFGFAVSGTSFGSIRRN